MRKGVSPVVATVILISVSVLAGMTIYWWVIGFQQVPAGKPDESYKIDVVPLNWTTGEFAIRNVDYRDMPAISIKLAQNQSNTCALPALSAGSSHNCTFGSGLSGQVTFYGKRVDAVTLYH